MKKLNVLICVLLMLFSLTACGNTAEESEDVTTAEPTAAITAEQTSTALHESSTVTATEATAEVTTVTATTAKASVVTANATATHTTTEPTTEKVTTTKPTTARAITTKATTTEKQTTAKATTAKPTTTKPTTTKPTTTKPTTTKPTTTEPTTTVPTTQTTTSAKSYCTVRIECNTIYDNIGKLKSGKKAFLPASGVILDNAKVELRGGESAFDVIKKACEENVCTDSCQYCRASGIQIEYTYTPAFNNYYIEGIHQIYEKDCGTQSGWMYSVNGEFPDEGTSSYTVSSDDAVVLYFTCNMGEDIGNSY